MQFESQVITFPTFNFFFITNFFNQVFVDQIDYISLNLP